MFTYYKGSDGEWYYEALENAYGNGEQYKYTNGEQVAQKSANSYKWFKVEPIKWRVLTDNYSGKKLILCESGIYANVRYYIGSERVGEDMIYDNNYMHSAIRAWLNGISYNKSGSENNDYLNKGFLQTAFDVAALAKIAQVEVDNSVTSTGYSSNSYACDNTNDKIFLLSYTEAYGSNYGFANDYTRIRKQTDFALANCAEKDSNAAYGGNYWLRSPEDFSPGNALRVKHDGSKSSSNVDSTPLVVVPALSLAP